MAYLSGENMKSKDYFTIGVIVECTKPIKKNDKTFCIMKMSDSTSMISTKLRRY